jgi:hypothetical protein
MNCPGCKSQKVVPGKLFNVLSGFPPFYFRPKGLSLVTVGDADVRIESAGFTACVDCGLVWATVPSKKLMRIIESSGSPKLQKTLK